MISDTMAESFPENPQPQGNWYRTLRTKLKSEPIVIYKCFLSKLIYTEEMLTEEERVALFLAFEGVEKEIANDPSYHKRYFWLYFITRKCFVGLESFCIDLPGRRKVKKELEPFFSFGRQELSARQYYSTRDTLEYKVAMETESPKKPKPRNRIGVGYRDKGSCADVAMNGWPSWEEICQDEKVREGFKNPKIETNLETLRRSVRSYLSETWHNIRAQKPKTYLAREMRG
jgi:hypothetical protein